ncbi:hypothetical protein F2Q69_00047381 [Brassica cretica]|uniref:Uncharacterized protein n=1 Tax=Brassica cretica TaxID=69181 RepID=A0A8S9PY78_BRACR|nr:hypothetical protein F2Q69_00047381 [Brassica cretica]
MLKSLVSLGTQNPISAREDQRIVNFQCSLELQRGRWSLWLREGRLLGLKASSDLIFPFQISGSRRRRLTLKSSMILFRDSGQTLLILDDFREIGYGPPTTFRRNSDGCIAVRRNSVGIVQSQTAIQRSYIFVGNGHMVRQNSVGKYRRNSDDFAVNRNVVGNSSEYTD